QFGRWDFAEFTEVYQIESDFKAKVEARFNDMIQSAIHDLVDLRIRAQSYALKHFGSDNKWSRLNDGIWSSISTTENTVFELSEIDAVAESAASNSDDGLALLSLLSSPSANILRLRLES